MTANVRSRSFEEGNILTPDLLGKQDMWDGQYKIQRRIGDVTYEVAMPGRRTGRIRVHVNMLKGWKQSTAAVCRIVVADEQIEDMRELEILGKSELSKKQMDEIREWLDKFADLTDGKTGTFENTDHTIATGEARPIRSVPYMITPEWKDTRSGMRLKIT